MGNLVNLYAESGASMVGDDATPTLSMSNSTGPALEVVSKGVANASISGLKLSNASMPSGAVLSLGAGAFVSAVSIVFAASANWAGAGVVRVVKSDGTFGWIPVLPDGVVTAAVFS